MSLLRTYRTECIVFLVALLVRAIGVLLIASVSTTNGVPFPVSGADSKGYFVLAQNLLDQGVFSRSDEAPFLSDSFRTPGYPLFVAGLLWMFGTPLAVVYAQVVLSALSAVLLFMLCKIYAPKRLRWVPVILMFVNPTSTYLASVVLSETLFGFFLLASIFAVQRQGRSNMLMAGLLLGAATLVRPVGLLVLPCAVLFLYIRERRALTMLGIYVVAFGMVVFPWSLRNYMTFGSWQLSHVGTYNFYEYHATLFYATKHGISHRSAINDVFHKTLLERYPDIILGEYTLKDMPAMRAVAWEYVRDDVGSFSVFYLLKTIPFFITDGFTDTTAKIGISTPQPPNITSTLFGGDVVGIIKSIATPAFIFFWSGVLLWSIVFLGMCVGAWRALQERGMHAPFFLMIFGIIVFFAFATGTVANARLRDPVLPFMCLLAVYGFSYISSLWHTHFHDRV